MNCFWLPVSPFCNRLVCSLRLHLYNHCTAAHRLNSLQSALALGQMLLHPYSNDCNWQRKTHKYSMSTVYWIRTNTPLTRDTQTERFLVYCLTEHPLIPSAQRIIWTPKAVEQTTSSERSARLCESDVDERVERELLLSDEASAARRPQRTRRSQLHSCTSAAIKSMSKSCENACNSAHPNSIQIQNRVARCIVQNGTCEFSIAVRAYSSDAEPVAEEEDHVARGRPARLAPWRRGRR